RLRHLESLERVGVLGADGPDLDGGALAQHHVGLPLDRVPGRVGQAYRAEGLWLVHGPRLSTGRPGGAVGAGQRTRTVPTSSMTAKPTSTSRWRLLGPDAVRMATTAGPTASSSQAPSAGAMFAAT